MTRIGLLSDSHGRDGTTERAVRLLIDRGADSLIHLGDIGSTAVLSALLLRREREGGEKRAQPFPPVHIVFGNIDHDIEELTRRAEAVGILVDHPVGRLTVSKKSLIFLHGDHSSAMKEALESGADYLCHGHTHVARDEWVGRTRVINPGALCRARRYTVALLEPGEGRLLFIDVPRS